MSDDADESPLFISPVAQLKVGFIVKDSLALSPDGRHMAVATFDGNVHLFYCSDDGIFSQCRMMWPDVASFMFSPCSCFICVAFAPRPEIRRGPAIMSVATMQVVFQLPDRLPALSSDVCTLFESAERSVLFLAVMVRSLEIHIYGMRRDDGQWRQVSTSSAAQNFFSLSSFASVKQATLLFLTNTPSSSSTSALGTLVVQHGSLLAFVPVSQSGVLASADCTPTTSTGEELRCFSTLPLPRALQPGASRAVCSGGTARNLLVIESTVDPSASSSVIVCHNVLTEEKLVNLERVILLDEQTMMVTVADVAQMNQIDFWRLKPPPPSGPAVVGDPIWAAEKIKTLSLSPDIYHGSGGLAAIFSPDGSRHFLTNSPKCVNVWSTEERKH